MSGRHLVRTLPLAFVLATASVGSGCRKSEPPPAKAKTEPMLLGPESLATVEKREIASGPLLNGSLEARERAELVAEAQGSVLEVNAELGDPVKRGAVLARIETTGLGTTYESAQTAEESARQALAIAESDLARTRELVTTGALPRAQLDADQNRVNSARAQLADASARKATAARELRSTTIRAPMDGVVSEQNVHTGDVVSPGSKLITVIDPSSMRLEASVAANDLPKVKLGAPVSFEVRGFPGQRFEGKISRIAPAADPVTRQVSLLVSIPNSSARSWPDFSRRAAS